MTREEAIKTLHELWRNTNDPWYEEVYNMAIEALSAERTGEWIKFRKSCYDGTSYDWKKCSVCDHDMIGYESNYCPNCGAKMKGTDNEID